MTYGISSGLLGGWVVMQILSFGGGGLKSLGLVAGFFLGSLVANIFQQFIGNAIRVRMGFKKYPIEPIRGWKRIVRYLQFRRR